MPTGSLRPETPKKKKRKWVQVNPEQFHKLKVLALKRDVKILDLMDEVVTTYLENNSE